MSKRKTTEEFIADARKVHGDKYDYSHVAYIDARTPVEIVCNKHGAFMQTPHTHLKGSGCALCWKEAYQDRFSLGTDAFISRAKLIHGDKYDYSKVNYINSHRKVCIICPTHGEFWQEPDAHLSGKGCLTCRNDKSTLMCKSKEKTTETFIEKASSLNGGKYDYSKVDYKSSKDKVCIVCPTHGEFWQTPSGHLMGQGCPLCAKERPNPRNKSKEKFIEEAQSVHGSKYEYSSVDYKNSDTKVCIICPKHGPFYQLPYAHLSGNGCPRCANEQSAKRFPFYRIDPSQQLLPKDVFISKSRKAHGDKYDYSKVDYQGYKTKVCIICPEHGEFWQTPDSHWRGNGCPICSNRKRKSTEQFVSEARVIHGDRYDYSKCVYKNTRSKLCIICPEHGEFWQRAYNHLQGIGCPICSNRVTKTRESFIEEARSVHGDKYDYSKVVYINAHTKVTIVCPDHGEFTQTPAHHIHGDGCPICAGNIILSTEQFIKQVRAIHGDRYDYSKTEYVNSHTRVSIICKEHGVFSQYPFNHLKGSGCPICIHSTLEDEIRDFLTSRKVEFEEQKQFPWLSHKRGMRIDFYLPRYNVAIECQGQQHFWPVDVFGGDEGYEATLQRDLQKRSQCEAHGLPIYYYSNLGIAYPYLVFEDKDKMLNAIMQSPNE